MGKISGLPDNERLAIIGYLAQKGVVDTITAEVPKKKIAEFKERYGVEPYPIPSDKKYGNQYRVYLSDPDSAPPVLRAALDTKYSRLNDSKFVSELIDNYGFTFFSKQNSQKILERAKQQAPDSFNSFLSGYNTNSDFIKALTDTVQKGNLPIPTITSVSDEQERMKGKKKKTLFFDSNTLFSDEQLMYLGWAGEEYLYRHLASGTEVAFAPFTIDVRNVKDIVWFNQGYTANKDWVDRSIGMGGDILIKTTDSEYLIEVKSSKRRSPIFAMTSCEMMNMQKLRNRYYLAKLDYMENLVSGQSPSLCVYKDPFERFFTPKRMQKATFFCY